MAQQLINVGAAPDDRTGDPWRDAFIKVNANETELFNSFANGVVVVNSEADFPTPSGGVITTADETGYFMGAAVTTANRFVMGDNSIIFSWNFLSAPLTYTGSGNMFTGTDVSFRLKELQTSCPNGTVFNVVHSTPGVHQLNLDDFQVLDCTSWGTVGNCLAIVFGGVASFESTDGITFSGTNTLVDINQMAQQTTGGASFIGIDLGTSVNTILAITRHQVISTVAGAFGISGLAAGGNIAAGQVARVTSSAYIGAVTALQTITTDDVQWKFSDNDGIDDSDPDALLAFRANATATVISATSTDGSNAVLVAGTWVEERASQFTTTAAGRATYNGIPDTIIPITVTASFEPVSGVNKDLAMYIAINGTAVSETGMVRRTDSGNPGAVTAIWQIDASTTDFIEVFVENQTDTINILVNAIVMRVR